MVYVSLTSLGTCTTAVSRRRLRLIPLPNLTSQLSGLVYTTGIDRIEWEDLQVSVSLPFPASVVLTVVHPRLLHPPQRRPSSQVLPQRQRV